jgi:hypothetical protein
LIRLCSKVEVDDRELFYAAETLAYCHDGVRNRVESLVGEKIQLIPLLIPKYHYITALLRQQNLDPAEQLNKVAHGIVGAILLDVLIAH